MFTKQVRSPAAAAESTAKPKEDLLSRIPNKAGSQVRRPTNVADHNVVQN